MAANRGSAKPFSVKAAKSTRDTSFKDAAKTFPITAVDAHRIEQFVASLSKDLRGSPSSRTGGATSVLRTRRPSRKGKAASAIAVRAKSSSRSPKAVAGKRSAASVRVGRSSERPRLKRRLGLVRARLRRAALIRRLLAATKGKPAASA